MTTLVSWWIFSIHQHYYEEVRISSNLSSAKYVWSFAYCFYTQLACIEPILKSKYRLFGRLTARVTVTAILPVTLVDFIEYR